MAAILSHSDSTVNSTQGQGTASPFGVLDFNKKNVTIRECLPLTGSNGRVGLTRPRVLLGQDVALAKIGSHASGPFCSTL